jgi:hypothetical protein
MAEGKSTFIKRGKIFGKLIILTLIFMIPVVCPVRGEPSSNVKIIEIKCGGWSTEIVNPPEGSIIPIPLDFLQGNIQIHALIYGREYESITIISMLENASFSINPLYLVRAEYPSPNAVQIYPLRSSDIDIAIKGRNPRAQNWTVLLILYRNSPLIQVVAMEPFISTPSNELFKLSQNSLAKSLGLWLNRSFAFLEKERIEVEVQVTPILLENPSINIVRVSIDKSLKAPYIYGKWKNGSSFSTGEYLASFKTSHENILSQLSISLTTPPTDEVKLINAIEVSFYKNNTPVKSHFFPIYILPQKITIYASQQKEIDDLKKRLNESEATISLLKKKIEELNLTKEREIEKLNLVILVATTIAVVAIVIVVAIVYKFQRERSLRKQLEKEAEIGIRG